MRALPWIVSEVHGVHGIVVQPRMRSVLVVDHGRHWAVPGRMSSVEHCSEGPEVKLVVERKLPWHFAW